MTKTKEEQSSESNQNDESGTRITRRNVIKSVAIVGGVSYTSSSDIFARGNPVSVSATTHNGVEEDLDDAQEAVDISSKGDPSIEITRDTNFQVGWEDLVRGDVIEFRMRLMPDQVSHAGGIFNRIQNHGEFINMDNNFEVIGQKGIQVNEPNRTESEGNLRSLEHDKFFEDRQSFDLTDHTFINSRHLGIDLDRENNNFSLDELRDIDSLSDIGIDESKLNDDRLEYDSRNGEEGIWLNGDLVVDFYPEDEDRQFFKITTYKLTLESKGADASEFDTTNPLGEWDIFIISNAVLGFGRHFGKRFGVVNKRVNE